MNKEPLYEKGEYKVYATSDKTFFEVTGNNSSYQIHSLRGAKISIDLRISMTESGFDNLGDYIDHINNVARELQKKRQDEKIDAQKRQDEKENTTNSNKPLYVNMDSIRNLPHMNQGRVLKILKKDYRTLEGSISSLRDLIENGKYIDKESMIVPKIQYNRTKYNRMNGVEQEIYDKKLEEKKTIYTIKTESGSFMEIPKILFPHILCRF